MKRLFFFVAAVMMAAGLMAQDDIQVTGKNKMAFTVGGPFKCRVVYLNEDNSVKALFGEYTLKGYDDTDSNANDLRRGYRIGIQMANDCPVEVTFAIEYKDYPFYDAVLIYVNERSAGYDDSF